jgi:hypothetical protein
MSENDTPEWLPKAVRETDDLARRVTPVVRAVRQYVEEARSVMDAAGPSLLSGRELALAMDAGMREFFTAIRQQRNVSFTRPQLQRSPIYPRYRFSSWMKTWPGLTTETPHQ